MVRITLDKPYIPIPVLVAVKYGLLYNWYAATDMRLICADGWNLATYEELSVLLESGAINYFNWRTAGIRLDDGSFYEVTDEEIMPGWFWSIDPSEEDGYAMYLHTDGFQSIGTEQIKRGHIIRIFRDATESEQLLSDGTACNNYTGNDGKVYRTVKIGTQVWLADNLAETKYRNGDTIPEVTDNAAWAALTTGALCAYNNDWSNVLI